MNALQARAALAWREAAKAWEAVEAKAWNAAAWTEAGVFTA